MVLKYHKILAMKHTIQFMLFIIYTVSIFFINNFCILSFILFINITLMLFYKISFLKVIYNLYCVTPFILITAIFNIFLSDFLYTLLVISRLYLVCNITYIFSNIMSFTNISKALKNIFIPLKIFKINIDEISLIIQISIIFLPILTNEFHQIKYSLKSKHISIFSITGIMLCSKILLNNTFKRINSIEHSLNSKGIII